MSPNAISEAGKISFVNARAKELGITGVEYVNSKYISELEMQFGCTVTKAYFIKKYKEYLI